MANAPIPRLTAACTPNIQSHYSSEHTPQVITVTKPNKLASLGRTPLEQEPGWVV